MMDHKKGNEEEEGGWIVTHRSSTRRQKGCKPRTQMLLVGELKVGINRSGEERRKGDTNWTQRERGVSPICCHRKIVIYLSVTVL